MTKATGTNNRGCPIAPLQAIPLISLSKHMEITTFRSDLLIAQIFISPSLLRSSQTTRFVVDLKTFDDDEEDTTGGGGG
ncbi:hypothetical protein HanXRQr2_Chr03g0112211 [Helianthus annuus]|uniref:Uncharacterized protein n=1 Tax=Helianthus annuus TaxID=4232 RepID=A0A9K3NW26_HELAN|nr:hypothetical protein HanXRQr2_Chr03g0112211 [Helianthus annuus]KAJ0943762.1 hypothetical protein HanPSC8_Chr03g0108521 [Helianthus annuus]